MVVFVYNNLHLSASRSLELSFFKEKNYQPHYCKLIITANLPQVDA